MEQIHRGITPRITTLTLEPHDSNALKWFVKAIGSINEVDMFTSFVICLDILSHKINLDRKKITCLKCKEEIDYVHTCEEPLLRDAYAMDYLHALGLDEEKARKFNRLRNAIFHGKKLYLQRE